ncbi:MAG: Ig-like domain-containing protein [Anaerolineales bacterium]|nr:Ig-like domain-containing protein [Anaerolineales bacterium]
MTRRIAVLSLMILAFTAAPAAAQATEQPFELRLSRDFGYGGGSHIQGLFTMGVDDRGDVVRVEFLIDNLVVLTDTEAPFRYQFTTGSYALGPHTLAAVGYTSGGQELQSQERSYEFVTAEEGWQAAGRIAIPVIGLVILVSLAGTVGPALVGRRKPHRRGEYGVEGGAVCPRCRFPFSRHLISPNMLVGRLERCPHCGKWSMVRRATPQELEAAENRLAEEEGRGALVVDDEKERLRRMIDESRFEE